MSSLCRVLLAHQDTGQTTTTSTHIDSNSTRATIQLTDALQRLHTAEMRCRQLEQRNKVPMNIFRSSFVMSSCTNSDGIARYLSIRFSVLQRAFVSSSCGYLDGAGGFNLLRRSPISFFGNTQSPWCSRLLSIRYLKHLC